MCNTIFKPFAKILRLEEKIECVVRRHRNNYFVGWTEEQLQAVEETVRPVRCIASDEAASVISNNEKVTEQDACMGLGVRGRCSSRSTGQNSRQKDKVVDCSENGSGQGLEERLYPCTMEAEPPTCL
ncbi:hypothetical protein LSAT2_024699, partial [Lamellibrachia satsuma]